MRSSWAGRRCRTTWMRMGCEGSFSWSTGCMGAEARPAECAERRSRRSLWEAGGRTSVPVAKDRCSGGSSGLGLGTVDGHAEVFRIGEIGERNQPLARRDDGSCDAVARSALELRVLVERGLAGGRSCGVSCEADGVVVSLAPAAEAGHGEAGELQVRDAVLSGAEEGGNSAYSPSGVRRTRFRGSVPN